MTKPTRLFLAGSATVLAVGLCTGLVAYFAGGFPSVSASPVANELRYVPADATVVAYANVNSIMTSELRTRLKQAMPGQEQGQKEFQEHTGIDIERDIDYVVAAANLAVHNGPPLVIARGRFNDTQLEGLVRQHGGQVEEYKGKRLVVANRPIEPGTEGTQQPAPGGMALGFLEPGLLAIGDAAAVKKGIDAQAGLGSITGNEEMMQLVRDIGANNNAWAVGRFDVIAQQARLNHSIPEQALAQLSLVKWFAAAGHINGGIDGSLRAEARDDVAAQELRKGIEGLMAFARLATSAEPRAAGLVDSLRVSGTGKSVVLSFTLPAEVIDLAIPKPVVQAQ